MFAVSMWSTLGLWSSFTAVVLTKFESMGELWVSVMAGFYDGIMIVAPVDILTFQKLRPNELPIWAHCIPVSPKNISDRRPPVYIQPKVPGADENLQDIKDEDLCLLPPAVYGFSLSSKDWGAMTIDGLSPVVYRPEAFQSVVVDDAHKVRQTYVLDGAVCQAHL